MSTGFIAVIQLLDTDWSSSWVNCVKSSCGWSTATVREPKRRGSYAVGRRYQRAGEETTGCHSELQSVSNSDGARVNCNSELWVSSESVYQSKPRLQSHYLRVTIWMLYWGFRSWTSVLLHRIVWWVCTYVLGNTLKMESLCFSETLVSTYQNPCCHNPEGQNTRMYLRSRENAGSLQ